jgi:oligosaccharide repeat unit polymerase
MRNYRPSLTVSIFLCIFWLTLYIYWASRQGNPLTAVFGSRSAQRAVGVIKTNGYLVDSLYGAFGVVTAWLAYSVRENRIKLARILFLASLIFVVPSFLQGDRSKSVFFILVITILINGWNVKVKKIYIVVAIIIIPILIVAPRVLRQSQNDFATIGNAAFSVKNITETLTKEDTAMAPALAILLSNLGTNIPYMYGESYINLVAKPVPRALWPGKPIEFDTQMMRVLFPSYAASGVGFAFSAISEPLVNFGLTGVVVFFVGIGIFNRRNLEEMIKKRTSVSIFLNAWLAGFMFVLVRGNLSVDFQRAVFPIISGLIVLYFNDARAKIFRRD